MVSKNKVDRMITSAIMEHWDRAVNPTRDYIRRLEGYVDKYKQMVIDIGSKKELPNANDARALSVHGENSREWTTYQKQMEIIQRNIYHTIDNGEMEFYFMDEVCDLASYKLICMGYQVGVKEVYPEYSGCKTKISW